MVQKDLNELDVKLFYEDSYMESFDALVLECKEEGDYYRVVLSQTAFFPEGGGQYSDTGWLNDDIRVINVVEENGVIYHITDGAVEEGDFVVGHINFQERFDKMQQHTAEHIVSGIINEMFGINNVGFHLGKDDVTMDFDGAISKEELHLVENMANEAVRSNVVIETRFVGEEENSSITYRSKLDIKGLIRLVIIPGYDVCACCAPHVGTTGEIGLIKLTSFENYKSGIRVHMVCGIRALSDYNEKEDAVKELSHILSANTNGLVAAVNNLKQQINNKSALASRLSQRLVEELLKNIKCDDKKLVIYEEVLDSTSLRELVNKTLEITSGSCLAMTGEKGTFSYVLGSCKGDAREISKAINENFNGRGGGNAKMVFGQINGSYKDIYEFFMKKINL